MKKKKFILGLALPLTALTLGAVGVICVGNETVLTGFKAATNFHVNVTANNLIEKEGKFIAITNEEKAPLEFEITNKPADFKQNGKLGTFKVGTIIRNVTPIRGINNIRFKTNKGVNDKIFALSYGYDDKDGNKVIFGHDIKINNDYDFSNTKVFNFNSKPNNARPKLIRATYVEFKVLQDVQITDLQLTYECTDGNYIAPAIDTTQKNIYFNAVDSWKKGFIDISNAYNQTSMIHNCNDETNDDDGSFDKKDNIKFGHFEDKEKTPLMAKYDGMEQPLAALSKTGNYIELKFMSDKSGTFDLGFTWQSANNGGRSTTIADDRMDIYYGKSNNLNEMTQIDISRDIIVQKGSTDNIKWSCKSWYNDTVGTNLILSKGYNVIRVNINGGGGNDDRFPNIWRFNMLNINYTE